MPSAIRKLAAGAAVVLLFGVAGYFGVRYWQHGRFIVSTDDAYVEADVTAVAPKVAGYIETVAVEDNQPVKAGQVLARIDDRDIRTNLLQARAQVQSAEAQISTIQQQILQQDLVSRQQAAAIGADRAARVFSQQELDRYAQLVSSGAATIQRAQAAHSDIAAKEAALARDIAALGAANKQVDVLRAQLAQAEATLDHAKANQRQAELNLSYTTIVAAIDGTIGAKSVRVGQYVQAGTQLMAVVPLQSVYIVGNYKETQLTRVRAGQPVSIAIDAYPDLRLQGRVDSLAPASGGEFALLPPDNATGNFTKIVQRIPVKIVLTQADQSRQIAQQILRPGMSVEAEIDTLGIPAAPGSLPAAAPPPLAVLTPLAVVPPTGDGRVAEASWRVAMTEKH